jgi:hypothetical protein
LTFALEGIQGADVQLQRAREDPSEGPGGAFQWWIDLQFFIVSLRRTRGAAKLGLQVPGQKKAITEAIAAFDRAVPNLHLLRNVGEHIDDYTLGKGRNSSIGRSQLQVGGWDGTIFKWLDVELNAEGALNAARKLVGEVEWARAREMNRGTNKKTRLRGSSC